MQKFPFIISVKHKHRIKKNTQTQNAFNINKNISKPKREINSTLLKHESKKEKKEINIDNLSKVIINGFAFLYNKYDDIISFIKEKNKDVKIKLDKNNLKLQESIIKIYGEPKEEITIEEYVELLEFGYKLSKEIGRRHATI